MNKYSEIEKKKVLYTNNELDESQKNQIREEITSMFNKLSPLEKNETIEFLYPVLRDNISATFSSNNYKGIITSFKVIKKTKRWNNELPQNKVNTINMLIFGYLFLYLEEESNNNQYLLEATKLFDDVCKYDFYNIGFSNNQLENVHYIFNRNSEFITAIKNNDIWTRIIYQIPFPIYISNKEISFAYNGIKVVLKTEINPNKEQLFQVSNGFMDLEKDKYGLLNRTTLDLKINKCLSPNKHLDIYTAEGLEARTQVLTESLEIVNHIIKHYRFISDNYWLDNISHKMIQTISPTIYAGKTEIKDIIISDENLYKVSSEIPYLNNESIKDLEKHMSIENDNFLWESLLQDSKRYLLIANLREAIISLNSSFENFMYSKFKIILSKYMGEEEVELFYQGNIPYQEHPMAKIITREQFNELVKLKALNNFVPSVFQLVKMYYKHVPDEMRIELSKSKFNRNINKIKKNRNDIVHGNEVSELNSKNIKESIEAYEEIIQLILNKHF